MHEKYFQISDKEIDNRISVAISAAGGEIADPEADVLTALGSQIGVMGPNGVLAALDRGRLAGILSYGVAPKLGPNDMSTRVTHVRLPNTLDS